MFTDYVQETRYCPEMPVPKSVTLRPPPACWGRGTFIWTSSTPSASLRAGKTWEYGPSPPQPRPPSVTPRFWLGLAARIRRRFGQRHHDHPGHAQPRRHHSHQQREPASSQLEPESGNGVDRSLAGGFGCRRFGGRNLRMGHLLQLDGNFGRDGVRRKTCTGSDPFATARWWVAQNTQAGTFEFLGAGDGIRNPLRPKIASTSRVALLLEPG